jgi:hypothetical protein
LAEYVEKGERKMSGDKAEVAVPTIQEVLADAQENLNISHGILKDFLGDTPEETAERSQEGACVIDRIRIQALELRSSSKDLKYRLNDLSNFL